MILATCTAALSAPIFLLMHSNWLLDISKIPNHWNPRGCQNTPMENSLSEVSFGASICHPLYLRQGRKQIFPSIFGSSSCTSDEMTQLTRLWLPWKKYSEASVWSSPNGGSNILSPQKGCSPLESSWSLVSCRHPEERREIERAKNGGKSMQELCQPTCDILLHQGVWSISYNF